MTGIEPTHIFYCDDVITRLKKLKEKSVQCIVTSPPYFGLRNYGESKWEGGNPECNHFRTLLSSQKSTLHIVPEKKKMETGIPYKNMCGKCGAIRVDNQMGLENSPEQYISGMIKVARECRRVLRDDGVMFWNIGDSYWGGKGQSGHGSPEKQEKRFKNKESINRACSQIAGSKQTRPTDMKHHIIKPKELVGIPWMTAFAFRSPWLTCNACGKENHLTQWASFPDGRKFCPECESKDEYKITEPGFYLRNDNIWAKKACMPFPAIDRFVNSHEYVFLFSKSKDYYFDWVAVGEPVKISSIGRTIDKTEVQEQAMLIIDSGLPPDGKEKIPATFGKTGIEFGGKKYPDEVGGVYSGNEYVLTSLARKRDVWYLSTANSIDKHYAVFPSELPEIGIKAGTSEYGCCPDCGAPYRRLITKTEDDKEWKKSCGADSKGGYEGQAQKDYEEHGCQNASDLKRRVLNGMKKIETVGWQKTCKCPDAAPVPCVVLDPFMGSGTTAVVAQRLKRSSIGIDLDPANVPIQKKNMGIGKTKPLVETCFWRGQDDEV